ncbi:hypothetical protein KO361_00235 [Candidatus Woesearchaeota archaeon]|nr:hypothetical protein [Candidatus Woesearchaeota archaeon]
MKLKLLIIITIIIVISSLQIQKNVEAYNYEHVNVTTRVNVTNAGPEILQVIMDNTQTLSAGTTKNIFCNATILDWNGWDDITEVNATFYHVTSTHESADDGNTHYTNTSCSIINHDGLYTANYTCSFNVIHYANNGTWTCNVTTKDTFNFTDTLSNTTIINELYALNVTSLIDYGNLTVTETSDNQTATITNFGNMDINVSVFGYGGTDPVVGAGLAMICDRGSNITIENQRFSSIDVDWDFKTQLSSTPQDLGVMLSQPTDLTPIINRTTYWQLYVPPNPFGICLGTVRFTATVPS